MLSTEFLKKRSSVGLKGWRDARMPRRTDFHGHINFRPGTLAIPRMFIQFLLDASPTSSGRLTDVIMDFSPPTRYAPASFSRVSLLSLVARFLLPADGHDRCATLMRSLKYGSVLMASQFLAISQKPLFHATAAPRRGSSKCP